jgi:predicted transcriptional regulator
MPRLSPRWVRKPWLEESVRFASSAIDEAHAQIARGEVATDEEVEAAFAKFRGA